LEADCEIVNLAINGLSLVAAVTSQLGTSVDGSNLDITQRVTTSSTPLPMNSTCIKAGCSLRRLLKHRTDVLAGVVASTASTVLTDLILSLSETQWILSQGKQLVLTLISIVVPSSVSPFLSFTLKSLVKTGRPKSTFFNSEPFTHTGAIGTFNVSDDVTLYGGWTLGWDSGFDQFDNGSNFLGGFSAPVGEFTNLTYITTIGDFGSRGDDGYSHSFVFDTQLTDRLNWVVQSDLLRVDETGEDNVGINQYLLYNVSDCFGIGTRVEWWKGDTITGYAPHGGILPESGSHSYYAATFGVNYKPHANLIIRPEYRFDWSPALGYDEGYVGVDVIALY